METLIEGLSGVLIPQVVAGLIGGFLGAMISLNVLVYGWRLSILFVIGSVIAAGAFAEYLNSRGLYFILLHCGLGILVGILGNSALDAINVAAPEQMRKIINGTSEGILYKIKKYLPNGKNEE